MEDLGRFALAKDVFSSKGKVSNRKVMDSVGLQVRRQGGICKELQIVQGTSNLREVYLANDMKLEEFNHDDGFLVIYSPLYSTRLTILGPIAQLQRLHDCIFKIDSSTTAPISKQFGAKIVLPKNEVHCPLRSEVLSCPSAASPPDLKRKTSLSSALKPQQSYSFGVSNRTYKSGFSPPSKKSNCKSSPSNNNHFGRVNNNNKENISAHAHSTSSATVEESFGSCAKNLTSMLEMQGDEDLTTEQQLILDAISHGENVLYTGSAGTGKSTLLKRIIEMTRSKFGTENVHVTATTGLAACALGGATLHMIFNLPAIDESTFTPVARKQLIDSKCEKRVVQNRVRNMNVLIIDEVSMLGPRLLEVIDELCRKIRACDLPLGGIQCICTGDFFQLPPVIINRPISMSMSMIGDDNASQGSGGSFKSHQSSSQQLGHSQRAPQQQQQQQQQRYCFESSTWQQLFPMQQCYELRKVYRQQEGTPFASVLDEVRLGHPSMAALTMLNSRVNVKLHAFHGVVPTMLFTHRKEVEQVNASRLQDLCGQIMIFNTQDSGEASFIPMLQRSCPARATLELKIGAQVILLKSTQQSVGLVNGARAVVVRFQRDTRMPVIKLAQGGEFLVTPETFSLCIGGRSVAQRRQLPLDLGWAVSIHKAQGMTVDQAEVNLRGAFEFGQAYVALSRVRSLQGLCLKGPLLPAQIKADPRVEEFYRQLRHHRKATAGVKTRQACITSW